MGILSNWLAVAAWLAAVGGEPHLGLVYVDIGRAVPFAFPGLSREAESILRRAGVSVRWRPGGQGEPAAAEGELNVVMLDSRAGGALARDVIGATRLDDGMVRTVWVYVPSVADVLDVDARRWERWSEVERDLFATALGRVVAHEILHALVPDRPHVPGGLMSEQLSRAVLVAPSVVVPPEFQRALRGRTSPAWPRRGPPPAPGPPRSGRPRG
jgi:hypothetical protein